MSATKTTKKKTAKKFYGPDAYKRNEHGLLENVDYEFNEDGTVNWRAMIKPEFLYPNKGWFDVRNKPVPTSTEGLDDKQLLIMLGGIKELAKMRGYSTVAFDVVHSSDGYVNGVRMSPDDITITSGTSVVFASALADGDDVDIVAFGTFNVANIVST